MNNNLMLYGSIARGDYSYSSDIDLLTIVEQKSTKIIQGKLNISKYNFDQFKKMVSQSALFIFHLNKEGKILVDENGFLQELIYNSFKLRHSYKEEICLAHSLLMELARDYDLAINYTYINAKTAWCLRTIFAAIGAENGIPIFSARSIKKEFGRKAADLITVKDKNDYRKQVAEDALNFISGLVNVSDLSNVSVDSELLRYKADVLNRIRNNSEDIVMY